MGRKFLIVAGRVGPAFESHEERAEARHERERRIPGTTYIVTDAGRWPTHGSAGLRKCADDALVAELEASLK